MSRNDCLVGSFGSLAFDDLNIAPYDSSAPHNDLIVNSGYLWPSNDLLSYSEPPMNHFQRNIGWLALDY